MTSMDPRLMQLAKVLVGGVVVAWSWQQGYQASVRAYATDRAEVAALSARLSALDAMAQAAGGMQEWLARHQERLAKLKGKFSHQTQLPQLLNALVDTMKAGEIRLLNVSQGNLEPMQESDNTPLLIDGEPCYRLGVTVTAEGRYHALVEAMTRLAAESFPSLVALEQVELRRKDAAGARLDATLHVYLYVIGTTAPSPHA